MNKDNYRIVEKDGEFTIEKEFEKSEFTWFLFWVIKVKKSKVWRRVTKSGNESLHEIVPGLGILLDTSEDDLPPFKSLVEADIAIKKLINNQQPVYHYR
jgi:hypothetical protein